MKVFLVAGARPNFMKIAPIYRASLAVPGVDCRIITPVYGNEEVKDAEVRIEGFTKEIVPVLDGFLPK